MIVIRIILIALFFRFTLLEAQEFILIDSCSVEPLGIKELETKIKEIRVDKWAVRFSKSIPDGERDKRYIEKRAIFENIYVSFEKKDRTVNLPRVYCKFPLLYKYVNENTFNGIFEGNQTFIFSEDRILELNLDSLIVYKNDTSYRISYIDESMGRCIEVLDISFFKGENVLFSINYLGIPQNAQKVRSRIYSFNLSELKIESFYDSDFRILDFQIIDDKIYVNCYKYPDKYFMLTLLCLYRNG